MDRGRMRRRMRLFLGWVLDLVVVVDLLDLLEGMGLLWLHKIRVLGEQRRRQVSRHTILPYPLDSSLSRMEFHRGLQMGESGALEDLVQPQVEAADMVEDTIMEDAVMVDITNNPKHNRKHNLSQLITPPVSNLGEEPWTWMTAVFLDLEDHPNLGLTILRREVVLGVDTIAVEGERMDPVGERVGLVGGGIEF